MRTFQGPGANWEKGSRCVVVRVYGMVRVFVEVSEVRVGKPGPVWVENEEDYVRVVCPRAVETMEEIK